jgi:pimeloyl-[acyl-carrier protein] synthase
MHSEAVGDLSVASAEGESRALAGEGDRRYDLLDAAVLDDPYPLYDELRTVAPVYRDRRFFGCILTRYDDIVAVLKDGRVSSRRPTADERVPRSLSAIAEQLRELRAFQSRWMLYLDPPEHTRLRSLVNKSFTAATVARMRGRIQGLIDELLRPYVDGARFDVVQGFARPLPALVIADILGLPPEDRALLQDWSDGLAAGMVLSTGQDAIEGLTEAHRCQAELIRYFEDMIRVRRAAPREDLLSALIAAEEDGSRLGDDELIAMCVLLLFAGHETTTHLIGNTVLALTAWPSEFDRLRVEPALVQRAVEEFLRFDSPVQATGRRATTDMEIRGCAIRAGEFLTPVIGAANRDPSVFDHPDRLDISRAENRHLAFALGPHFCLGAPLARLEGQLAIGSVVSTFRHLERSGQGTRRGNFYMRGLESLPVVGIAA